MTNLDNFIKSKETQRILNAKPGEEGFSLVELVIVIAVLAILSAVAIPAFQGVQNRAKTAAVKNGLVNGVKECVVSSAVKDDETFGASKAYKGTYTSYTISQYGGNTTCYAAYAAAKTGSGLPNFWIIYDKDAGTSTRACDSGTIGCTGGIWD